MPKDPSIQNYRTQAATRLKERRAAVPGVMPNLTTANELYDPKRDKPMTAAQIGQAMAATAEATAAVTPPGLSAETVDGLKALHGAVQAQQPATQAPAPQAAEQASAPAAVDGPPPGPKVEDVVERLDDLDFDRLLRATEEDVINNERERQAVAKRVKPIDILDGLAKNEFVQDVPINEHLKVRYRTISGDENKGIRLLLFKWIDEDKLLDGVSQDVYYFMCVTASIVRINSRELPAHVVGGEFNEEAFTAKFKMVSKYPGPLLHSIGTHSRWFNQRVAECFATKLEPELKNG